MLKTITPFNIFMEAVIFQVSFMIRKNSIYLKWNIIPNNDLKQWKYFYCHF